MVLLLYTFGVFGNCDYVIVTLTAKFLPITEVLGSLKCDCAEQLQLALEIIQRSGPGIVIYLQQEGRGIGLANKIAAYSLQVSSNLHIGSSPLITLSISN